jgi:hypothetical protein
MDGIAIDNSKIQLSSLLSSIIVGFSYVLLHYTISTLLRNTAALKQNIPLFHKKILDKIFSRHLLGFLKEIIITGAFYVP